MVMTECVEVVVRSVRQTRAGEDLLELRKTTAQARTSFTEDLMTAGGADASSIKEMISRTMFEVRDLDC